MLIRGALPPYYTAPEITNDTRGLYVNVETLELSYYQRTRMEKDPRWCDITDIFKRELRSKDIVRALENQGIEVDRSLDDRIDDNMRDIERIVDREFPEQIIPPSASIREAIDIFYKVNASGVALTDAELALAQISGYWPEARDLIKAKLSKLAQSGFVLKLDFVVYALLGCMYHMGSDMRRLHGEENDEEIRRVWGLLDDYVLDYVFNFLRTRAYVDHTAEISSIYAVIPIIVFFFDKHGTTVPEEQQWRIVKWFYYSQVRARYVTSLQQKLLRVAIDLASVLSNTGEQERSNLLLNRSFQHTQTLPRLGWIGYGISDVKIYTLQGDKQKALSALRTTGRNSIS